MFIEHKQLFHWRRVIRKGREIAYCRRVIAGVMLFTTAAVVQAAPSGGQVTHGSADISQTTAGTLTHTDIDQNSQRVDIDWTGFDTIKDEQVNFLQPNELAVAINRISGNTTSFDGILNANGRIFLINQNGITFGSNAQVNAGSLLATTSDTDRIDDELQSAQGYAQSIYIFDGSGYGEIVNNGTITVSHGGFAVLAAPHVENNGYIQADLGQIELASTNDFTLNVDLRGDGLITFSTRGEWLEGETTGVSSSGTLQSKSGRVYLSANMASGIVEGAVNLDGIVDADQFIGTPKGTVMIGNLNGQPYYPGGTIKVDSVGNINIHGGADIHAIGGETVSASFLADRDITMGADGDPATIVLKASAGTDDSYYRFGGAHAAASLEMIAAQQGGTGTLTIADGTIEVTADATSSDGYPALVAADTGSFYPVAGGTTATATVVLEGPEVDINADFDVHARAESLAPEINDRIDATVYEINRTEALAVLDVLARGEIELDTSGNPLRYGERGDLTLTGDIRVSADATAAEAGSSKATANTLLAATGNTTVTGGIDVDAVATSLPGGFLSVYGSADTADANAALVLLAGVPPGLMDLLRDASLNRAPLPGTLSDNLTLANLDDLLRVFGGLVDDPVAFLDRLGGIGDGNLSYTGDANVNALADVDSIGFEIPAAPARAEATAAGYFVAGGDVDINTDPIRVYALAVANYDSGPYLFGQNGNHTGGYTDTEARGFLVFAAGLHDLFGGGDNGSTEGSDLTILGDVSARAFEQQTLNGDPLPSTASPIAGALTALLATGDITVRGADPLAEAGRLDDPDRTARVQGRSSIWQYCDDSGCTPVTGGLDGLEEGFFENDFKFYLAQLVIEAGGEIDIQPKTKIQPVGLFTDPVGPGWPGKLPLRFDASGRMLVATGADATQPPRIAALPGDIEAAILAGADPSTLLPPTASGGCLAAGRDAYTVTEADFFDRLISSSCESVTR